jgi:hypothetical protein
VYFQPHEYLDDAYLHELLADTMNECDINSIDYLF